MPKCKPPPPPPNNDAFTIAWICATAQEVRAANSFLHDRVDDHVSIAPGDTNIYCLRRIGEYHIVIARPPQGNTDGPSSPQVVKNLKLSFPKIEFAVLVGVGSGSPSEKHDIRLGDVVVGVSDDGTSQVCQFAAEDPFPAGFHLVDIPFKPLPGSLVAAIAAYDLQDPGYPRRLDNGIYRALRVRMEKDRPFIRPPMSDDKLYRPGFVKGTIDRSDEWIYVTPRPWRFDPDHGAMAHFGAIAIGNTTIDDGVVRDRIAAERDVLCFVTDDIEVLDQVPCLLIRGVCDYADAHKNEDWRGYASFTAAWFARELLSTLPPTAPPPTWGVPGKGVFGKRK